MWNQLSMPPWISEMECSEVEKRIPGFVERTLTSGADLTTLCELVKKPLRPMWTNPCSQIWDESNSPVHQDLPFSAVVCVSASFQRDGHPGLYIQGAGDDEESWAHGLQPSLFWSHGQFLADVDSDECVELCEKLVQDHRDLTSGECYQLDGSPIVLQTRELDPHQLSTCYRAVVLDFSSKAHQDLAPLASVPIHRFPVGTSQKTMRIARSMLAILDICQKCLRPPVDDGGGPSLPVRLVLYSRDSLGPAMCVAYAVLAVHCDGTGKLLPKPRPYTEITKQLLADMNMRVISQIPQVQTPLTIRKSIWKFFLVQQAAHPRE